MKKARKAPRAALPTLAPASADGPAPAPTGNAQFDAQILITLGFEGGLLDDRARTGELSNFGISLRSYPELGAQGIINLTQSEAVKLYKALYDRYRCDEFGTACAGKVFDMLVNPGPGAALKCLNAALAKYGSRGDYASLMDVDLRRTIAIAASGSSDRALAAIRNALVDYYTERVRSGAVPAGYLKGLLRRARS